jgi:carotenoid 1,2-hydratase
VEPGGYAWWYVDALSRDGAHGLTLIAFVGSVFSPYYAHARRRGCADPTDHCAINLALYGKGGSYWSMTERGRSALDRTAACFAVGPSALQWDGKCLTVNIEEWTVPFPRRLKGRIRLSPHASLAGIYDLDGIGSHLWQPMGPLADVEVDFECPRLKWTGSGYLDHNIGREPLETGFKSWDWSRTVGGTSTTILYDAVTRDVRARSLALSVSRDGEIRHVDPPPRIQLPSTLWRIRRSTRADAGSNPRVMETLEDTPFYARSLVETTIAGRRVPMFHESLDLDRFANRVVQAMLPFRMPRRSHWPRPTPT